MKVVDLRATPLAIPHKEAYAWAIGAPIGTNSVLVEVVTDEGISGYGDACGTRSAAAVCHAAMSVAPLLLDTSAFEIRSFRERAYRIGAWSHQRRFFNQVLAGIEMALWDVVGKALRQPVHRLLGGAVNSTVQWFGFVQGQTPSQVADSASALCDRGFSILYMKIGLHGSDDVERVAAVREAVGPEPRLRLDVNESWDRYEAVRMLRRLDDFDLDWVEQPLAAEDVQGHYWLSQHTDIPLVLDQAIFTLQDVAAVTTAPVTDTIVLGFHETGGILALGEAATIAAANGVGINRHAVLGETGLSTMAALQALAPIANLVPGHQYMNDLFAEDVLVDGTFQIGPNGASVVPETPGLGAALDWDRIEKFSGNYERHGQYPM